MVAKYLRLSEPADRPHLSKSRHRRIRPVQTARSGACACLRRDSWFNRLQTQFQRRIAEVDAGRARHALGQQRRLPMFAAGPLPR